MRTPANTPFKGRCLPALLAGSAVAASATHVEAQDWTKHFRVGMQLTLNVKAEFTTGGTFGIPTRPGIYDDGYVLDDSTPGNSETTNWGYDHQSQVSMTEAGNFLTFTRTESFSVDSLGSKTRDDSPYIGVELAYGGTFMRWGDALIGWEAGYSFLPIGISDRRPISGSATRFSAVHEFSTAVSLPAPGYRGSASGQGQTVIEQQPTDTFFTDQEGVSRGSRELDVTLHNLRLGPTILFPFARRWAVQGSLGPAIGYVTGDYKFREQVSFAGGESSSRTEGEFGDSDFVYGGYISGIVTFNVEQHGDIYAGVQLMSLSSTTFEKDDRRAKLDLGAAFSFLVGINWPF
jgi:hypothetical protein